MQISQGKRNADDFKGAWDDLLSSLQNGATNLANQLTSRKYIFKNIYFL